MRALEQLVISGECLGRDMILWQEPPLLFSKEQSERDTTTNPRIGLRRYGPYDVRDRSFSKIKLIPIVGRYDVGPLLSWMKYLRDGYDKRPKAQWDVDFRKGDEQSGMPDIYGVDVEFPESEEDFVYMTKLPKTTRDCVRDYARICQQAVEENRFSLESDVRPLALFVTPEHHSIRVLDLEKSIYYQSKRALTNSGFVPSQAMSQHPKFGSFVKVTSQSKGIGFNLWNLSLNIYAKVGGIPWVLKQPAITRSLPVDAFVGIRLARARKDTSSKYHYGVAQIFDRWGRWVKLITNSVPVADLEGTSAVIPSDKMQSIAQGVIETYWKKIGQEVGKENPSAIVFHKPGHYHWEEKKAISRVMEDNHVDGYALVSVIAEPSFRIFGPDRDDEMARSTFRGLYVPIEERVALLCTTGAYKVGNDWSPHKMGTPQPILVTVETVEGDERSEFLSIEEACRQIFALTCLNWGTATAQEFSLPATLFYAQQVAQLLAAGVIPQDPAANEVAWFL